MLNQYCENSLFNDALHIVIIMSLKLSVKAENPFTIHNVILNNEPKVVQELLLLAFKKVVWDVMNSFLLFLRKYEERKAHNMLCLMLNSRHKGIFPSLLVNKVKLLLKNMMKGLCCQCC